MGRHAISIVLLAGVLSISSAAGVPADTIPVRPEELGFPPLTFDVPDGQAMRTVLDNGVPVYLAEDRQLPLISMQIYLLGGQYLEPEGKEGVASLTGTVWRSGGAGELGPRELDEELDFLAAILSTNVGPTVSFVSLNLLSKDIDRGLELLMDVLARPQFAPDRLDRAREELISEMRRRNDDTTTIESRKWNRLLYGDDFWMNRLPTRASVTSITSEDLAAFHKRLAHPANMVVAVAGDFERKAMLDKLNSAMGAWNPEGGKAPPVPQPTASAEPGVYLVHKEDVNQGRVSIGHLGAVRPVEDEMAITVANDILGGGGFTSWIMSRVRSDEGLAYSAGSRFGIGDFIPGAFRAFFQSQSATCARAAQLTRELIERMRSSEVTERELATSKNSFVETFPRTFESRARTAQRFAMDEVTGRPADYWQVYRDRVRAVNAEAVQQAAQRHIAPEGFIVLVVGNVEDILKGHPDHPEASFEGFGPFNRIPLRDPMTLEPLTE